MDDSFQPGKNTYIRREMTTVNVGLGYTLNIGNFENIRIDVGVTDEVAKGETTDEAIERVYELVGAQLVNKVASAKEDLVG